MHTAAREGKVHIFWGELEECLLIRYILRGLKTEIRDTAGRSPPSLKDLSSIALAPRIEFVPLSQLPFELSAKLLRVSFALGDITFDEWKDCTRYPLSDVNLSVRGPGLACYVSQVDDRWLALLAKNSSLVSLGSFRFSFNRRSQWELFKCNCQRIGSSSRASESSSSAIESFSVI